jgi:hypothetical protein
MCSEPDLRPNDEHVSATHAVSATQRVALTYENACSIVGDSLGRSRFVGVRTAPSSPAPDGAADGGTLTFYAIDTSNQFGTLDPQTGVFAQAGVLMGIGRDPPRRQSVCSNSDDRRLERRTSLSGQG